MTLQEFLDDINDLLKNHKPDHWRRGQTVFNYIDDKYQVARIIQHQYGIDCFYDDKNIPDFLTIAYKLITNKHE